MSLAGSGTSGIPSPDESRTEGWCVSADVCTAQGSPRLASSALLVSSHALPVFCHEETANLPLSNLSCEAQVTWGSRTEWMVGIAFRFPLTVRFCS